MDLSRFSTEDLRALKNEDLSKVSTEGLRLLQGQYATQPESPKERTWGEAAKDIGAGVTSGVGSLVQLPGQLYGLATGNFEDTGLLGLGKSIAKTGEEMKSEALKQKEAQRSQRIQEAEKQGQWEAFKTAAGETIKDPALLTSFLAEQAPQMVVPFGAAKVGKALTLGKGLGAGLAAEEAAQAAGTAGTRAAIGAGAVQQGADIGTGTYENVYKTLVDKGTPQEEAKSKALNLARASGASGAIISLLAQKLPGAKTLEESFAGVPGTTGRLLGAAKGALGEATSEVAEEAGGKFAQNVAMRQVSPEQELTQGLGATAGMAAIGGAGFGGVAGGLRTPQEAPQPAQATQPSPVVPEAPQIDPDKYRSAIEQLRANIPEAGISDAQKIADIFKTAGIQDETEISSYVKQATDNGDIKAHISPFFDVKDANGATLFRTTEQAIADKAAERLNAEEPNKASVAPIEITTLRNNAGYPPGYDIKQGRFKQQEFDIVSGDIVLSPKPMTMDDVDQKAQRLAEIRKDGIKGIDKEVKGLQEKVNQNNLSVESMEAEGQANTPEYATLSQQVVQDNLAIQKSIEELTAKKTSFTAPLLVRPAKASDEGFTVFQNGKPLYYFPTLEQAEETVDAAPTSVPTQEAIAAKEALRQTLLPFMKQVGLEGTGLRIMDSIESAQGSGDGYYAQNLIAIALSAPNPMATLRHETIHALKELGAFTDQEWKLLESTAKKDWINRFIKNRNTQDGKSLYEAYKAIYLQDKGNLEGFDSYITEEAIADAFKYFNANGTPPGMLSQIFAKIKAFLESLGNQFSGLGFQTADQVFKRVEMGQMRPTRAAPVGNAPRYQEEEPKYSVSPALEGVPKKAQTTSTAPTAVAKAPAAVAKAPAAVAVTPTAVAVTNRAKPTKVMSMEDLGKVIPASERVVSKNPSRLLNGKKFSKANLNKVGEGFFIYKEYGESDAEGLVKKIWEDSIADVEDFVSGSRVGTFIQDLVKSLGAKPPTAKFLNDSFSLSDSARYWYETSAEALDQTTLNIKNKDLLINLISATSQNVPPLPNMRRGISVMSEYTQGKPIETDLISKKPVADAISNRDIQTLKFGNFADTMKFINGYTPNPPVSTNDRQVAAIFNMQPDEFAKNPVLYAVVSKFYAKIRDSQNKMQGEGKQPYESWQIQALNWVEERGNNTSYGTKTADSYDQAIEVITEQLKNAGIPLEKGKIGMSTLKDPRVPNLLSGTMDVFQDAVKATVESNTLLNKSGSEANQEYEKIKDINEPWARNLRKEFLMIQTRVLKNLSSSKAIETIAKLATGQNVKAFAMSRMDATARGTFEGNLSPNIRIPMFYRNGATKTLITDPEINFILSVLGSGLDQAAMAGSLFKPDINGETYRVFLPDRKITDDEATTFEKNVGFPLNLYDVPNGAVVEINIGGYDTRPTAASVQAALNATFGNNVNAKIAKASYKSTYLTKEKVEYAPSYREVIYDYRDSKFGRGNKNGFRRAFDDRLATIAKQLIAIARERDGQFGEFTKDSREKRTAYEQKIGSKTDWAVMGGPSGGKYQLTAARINVDGVMRPTRNSRGAFIATTPEGIQNFWRWFGNSIMVDSKGFPRVMMHGTARDFERFMPKQAEAIFVTDEPFFSQNFSQLSEDWIAKNYDDPSVGLTDEDIKDAKRETLSKMDDLTRREYGLNMKTDPQKFIEYGIDEWRTAVLNRAKTRANTVPLYVKLENPFNYQNKDHVKMVVDEMTKNWNGNIHKFETDTLHLIETTISKKQLDGYLSMGDWGYIEHPETIAAIKNLDFDGITMREDMADKNYAVFNRNNVKSAVGNLGAFGQRKLTQEERKAESEREGRTITAKEAKTRQEEGYIRYSISSPDTPTFKRWFKDSRVVDKDGNPLVMYHATKTPEEGADLFSVFNKSDDGKLGQGIYTTAVEKYAESFAPNGVVMPLWVSIQNPLYLDLTASIQKGRSARDILRSKVAGEEPSREVDYLRLDGNGSREISNGLNAEIQAITGKRMMDMSGASIKRALQKAGYDGIIVRDADGNFVEVNAFDQTQIKSAIGNRGTYSESNKDIRYSIRSPDTPEFKRWFGDSKVVDKDGKPLVVYHGSVSKGVTVFDTKLVTTRSPKGDIAGTFFTSDLMAATGYTRPSRATSKTPRGEVIQAYLSIKNPLNTTAAIKKYRKEGLSFGDAKRKAINALTKENDGIIFDGDGVNPSEYIVFSPNQIKSATGNRGTFNENNPDIRYSLTSPVWYSELSRQIDKLPQKEMTAAEWKALLVNPEEIKSRGVRGPDNKVIPNEFITTKIPASSKLPNVKMKEIEDTEILEWLDVEGTSFEVDDYIDVLNEKYGVRKKGNTTYPGWEESDLTDDELNKLKSAQSGGRKNTKISTAQVQQFLADGGSKIEFQDVVLGTKSSLSDAEARQYREYQEMAPDDFTDESLDHYTELEKRFRGVVNTTKFEAYKLAGGENYREAFVTVPNAVGVTENFAVFKDEDQYYVGERDTGNSISRRFETQNEAENALENFNIADRNRAARWVDGHSPYSGIDNPVVRIRFDDRVDSEGKKVLFLEELQPPNNPEFEKMPKSLQDRWLAIGLKRMIRHAAEDNYDKIAWTTGEQQVERYRDYLRDSVDSIEWEKTSEGVHIKGYKSSGYGDFMPEDVFDNVNAALNRNDRLGFDTLREARRGLLDDGLGTAWLDRWDMRGASAEDIAAMQAYIDEKLKKNKKLVADTTYKETDLTQAIGKLMADRIRNDPSQTGTIEGEGLSIDSVGVKKLYDVGIPSLANKILKELGGGKVGETKIGGASRYTYTEDWNGKWAILKDGETYGPPVLEESAAKTVVARLNSEGTQPSFDITPPLREKALSGVPRYSLRDDFDADFNANFGKAGNDALNRATYVRQEKGFARRIAEAISPDSVTAIRQKLLNKYEAVERLSKMVAADTRPGFLGAKELLADVSANAAALQADRAAGVAAEALMNGIPVYEKGYTKVTDMGGKVKGLIPILEPLLKKYQHPKILQMFQFYSATRRGIRLYNEGRERVLTPADFALGKAFETKYPEFKTAYDEYQKFNEGLVKFLIDTGVLSKAMGAEWTKYGDYIPFYRQIDGETTVGPKMFQNLSNIKITPELTGGDKQIGDYLETVVRNTRSAIEQGMKNVAAQRIVRDIMRLNTQGMNDMGRKLQPHEKSGSDVVTVRENGDDVRYQVIDPLLVESMKSLHNMGINSFWTLMSYPTQLLRTLVTKEPSFILANLARDSVQAWVTSGVSMTPIVDTFKQFGKVLANQSPEAKALRAAGIGAGYEFSGDIKASAKAVADALNDRAGIKTGWQKAMWPVSKVWDALDKGSNASDLATRAEIYKKVLAETGNEAEAIHQSLEVMNFGRMGSSPMIQVISALVPFFNARVQGMDVLYRAGFGRMASQNAKAQHKAFMYRALFIAAMSSLYWLMARDTDEWKRASKETRDNYWLIGNVKIPIPFEIGVLFKVAPERILETAFGNDTGGDLAESALRNIISTLKINPVPQAFLPILEESVNYSLFTGMPIVGRGMENVAAPYQRNSSTTELSIMLGEQLNLSPIRIDHVISAYTGSMGMYMAQMIGGVINTVSGSEATRPAMSIEQTPVLKRFFASDKAGGTIDAFYSLKKEVDVVVRTQHELQSRGNPEQYAEYMEKNGQLLGLKGLVSSIDRQLTHFRELRNKIQFSSLDPQEKRETLDNIRYAEIAITENIKEIKKNVLQ